LNAAHIAKALGGEVIGRDRILCPGPGHSPKDRSLQVTISPTSPDGLVVHSFAGDDWRLCRDHVRQKLELPAWQPGDEQDRTIPPACVDEWDLAPLAADTEMRRPRTEEEEVRIRLAHGVWDAADVDPRGTLAEIYLRQCRGLDLLDELCGRVLRFHPGCPWRNENTGRTERMPALIAAFRSVDDDKITAVHRILLNPDGTKYDRRMLGIVHRAAVKLDPLDGATLTIGEGVETCMAARQLGLGPVWALGSVGAISFFPICDGVKRLRILGETGKASERSIRICGRRWKRAGRHVQIIMPTIGEDMNDALIGRAS
jgi:hypothetical protein